MERFGILLVVLVLSGCGSSDSATPAPVTDANDDVAVDTTVTDGTAVDTKDAADTTTIEVSDAADASGLTCGDSTCKDTEWCVIPCCGGVDTGVPCTPPPRYCAPAGCSGSGCDSLCFGRSSVADPTKKTVTCMCG